MLFCLCFRQIKWTNSFVAKEFHFEVQLSAIHQIISFRRMNVNGVECRRSFSSFYNTLSYSLSLFYYALSLSFSRFFINFPLSLFSLSFISFSFIPLRSHCLSFFCHFHPLFYLTVFFCLLTDSLFSFSCKNGQFSVRLQDVPGHSPSALSLHESDQTKMEYCYIWAGAAQSSLSTFNSSEMFMQPCEQ